MSETGKKNCLQLRTNSVLIEPVDSPWPAKFELISFQQWEKITKERYQLGTSPAIKFINTLRIYLRSKS